MNSNSDYELAAEDAASLLTPCLLVYPQVIRENLAEAIRIAGDVARLRPHVKTHKTAEIVQLASEAGVTKHKCATLAEASMLATCQVPDVLLAYPQIGPNLPRLAELIEAFPTTRFSTVVDSPAGLEQLEQHFSQGDLDVLLDIDTGMHRTGITPGDAAVDLVEQIAAAPGLRFAGLHVYDGQNHQPSRRDRDEAVTELMRPVTALISTLANLHYEVPKIVCGGTPTFPVFAELQSQTSVPIELSPGTCVLSDYNYCQDYPDMDGFRYAALLLTRVISKTGDNRLTVDLGYKAVASDPPANSRCHFLYPSDARLVQQSEEHLVIATAAAENIAIGDVLYAVPAHVCPTVALHARLQVVEGGRLRGAWPVTARDRLA
ncbi:MAG: D-TA family PLP-dependent enzyme [Pirellulaceae bacterium]